MTESATPTYALLVRALAVEVVVFSVRGARLETLLVRKPGNVWSLPGREAAEGRTLAQEAQEALAADTGILGVEPEQLFTFDRAGGAGAVVAYLALVRSAPHPVAPGRGVVEVRWFAVDDLPVLDPEQTEVLAYGRARVQAKASYAPVPAQLLPETFSIGELHRVYEAVLGRSLDARNFRRDVAAAGVLEGVGLTRSSGPGRPAQLYRWAGGQFSVVAAERRLAKALAGEPELGEGEETAP